MQKLDTINNVNLRILSIDPGTQNLGVSFAIANLGNKTFEVINVETIDINRIVNVINQDKVESYTKYGVMVDCVYDLIANLLIQYQPDWVICESPYMNSRFPLPYALLTLCTQTINRAVYNFHPRLAFTLIDPASVKKNIGVKGNSSDKTAVLNAVLNQPMIYSKLDLSIIDEHSSDAIAIGYYGFIDYLKTYKLLT